MTYFDDGSPYSYYANSPEGPMRNIGWLDSNHGHRNGDVERAILDALTFLVRERSVNLVRGIHKCNLCDSEKYVFLIANNTLLTSRDRLDLAETTQDVPLLLGCAQIRIRSESGLMWAAPELIIHYIRDHAYRPCDEFLGDVQALIESGAIPALP